MAADKIQTVGIIGAGTMGQGIAQICATYGYAVLLFDIDAGFLKKGVSNIESALQLSVDKGKLSANQKQEALNRIKSCKHLEQVKADLIIEAAIEKLDVKREIFKTLENSNSPDSILATNTSSIPVTQIASVLKNPNRFAGLHFFNPAHIMKLVEVISGVATSAETLEQLRTFSEKLGKTPISVKDSPGFVVNRVARHYYVETLKILEENVTDIKTIDTLLRSTGFKMGAFELMDLIGVDTNFSVTASMYNAFHQDGKFRPSRIQQQKVDAGHLGQKSGKGFYDYNK
ncbi:MAG TPA: 3-hydroxyacyl-CoA dehydrogenase NAD-binding domain-containing protein [Cyclobacteriaceae bacterium]|nr:3-hydroxyacyl-CoA dehydrogenase NAD-binding domain-containing protein [Cyclobacteriaceae bacterium]